MPEEVLYQDRRGSSKAGAIRRRKTGGNGDGATLRFSSKYAVEQVWKIGREIPRPPVDLPEPQLSENAEYIGKTRYALRNNKSEPVESSKEMFWRVAYNIAAANLLYKSDKKEMLKTARSFYHIMSSQRFIPNTPTMLNAGKPMQQLSGCFVLPIEDNMESIAKTMVDMVMVHKSGGGTGFSFSRLRPYGDYIASSGGTTTGPCGFLAAYNDVTSQVKQGGVRRGANMGIMHITHPDILRFAVMKVDEFNLTNFNTSITVTEDWMGQVGRDKEFVDEEPKWEEIIEEIKAAQTIRDVDLKLKKTEDGVAKLYELVRATEDGEGYELINPRTEKATDKINAYKVFLLLTKLAWQYGDPGMIMIDRINKSGANPTPQLGQIEATNPCGEQPLMPYDSCTLGSINVGKFVRDGEVDYEKLGRATEEAVHFLDNVLDMNNYPIPEISEMTRKIRRIGLGVMGFADLLLQLEIGYNTDEGLQVAEEVMGFIQKRAREASIDLAKTRGAFPAWKGSIYDPKSKCFRGEALRPRNGAVTTIAPTGTIAMLADASSGIEPHFALSFAKNTIEGKRLFTVNPVFLETAKREGFYSEELLVKIEQNGGSVRGLREVPERWQKVFVTARDIDSSWHVRMQAAFQRYVDNAISKTINFPNEAKVEDVRRAFMMVYETGCKGITIYRDGSRQKQILEVKKDKSYYDQLSSSSSNQPESRHAPEIESKEGKGHMEILTPRPERVSGATYKITTPLGTAFITINDDENEEPLEVFINIGRAGSDVTALAEALGRIMSASLRFQGGLSPKQRARELASQLSHIGGSRSVGFGPNKVRSLPDAVSMALAKHYGFRINGNGNGGNSNPNSNAENGRQESGDPGVQANGSNSSSNGLQAEAVMAAHNPDPTPASADLEFTITDICPECGSASLVIEEGCAKCYNCGHSKC